MQTKQMSLSRRQLLKRTGWLGGGLTLVAACDWLPALPTFSTSSASHALTWLQLQPNGTFVFYCPRTEMGQGIASGLTALVAEELNVPLSSIACRYPRSDQIPPTQLTVGSESMSLFYEPTARMAANFREVLRSRLAEQLGVESRQIELRTGGFTDTSGNRYQYRELVAPQDEEVLAVDIVPDFTADTTLLLGQDPVHQNRYVGKFVNDHEIGQLVTGRTRYSSDIGLPNLHYGQVVRPPFLGAVLLSCETAEPLPPATQQVRGPSGELAVIGPTPMAVAAAIAQLQPQWSTPTPKQARQHAAAIDIDAAIAANTLDHQPVSQGDLTRGARSAKSTISLRLDSPMTAHAAMEPRSGTAMVANGVLEIWTASQDPWLVQRYAARLLGWSPNKVIVHNHRVGGAFGGRALCQASIEAAWLAAATKKPIKVQWSREEEFRFNYVGPAFSHRIDCGVTATGEISHWHHQMLGAPILTSSTFIPKDLRALADLPADPGTQRGTQLPYHCQHQQVSFGDERGFMPTGPWRGLGAAANVFAVESAIDALAQAAQTDALVFRQQQLLSLRLKSVTELVAKRCAWHRPRPPQSALGLAVCAYKDATFVAVVAEVRVIDTEPTLTKLWCVQDCGQVIAPDQVRAQVEGNLTWGISMARHENYQTRDGLGVPSNFHDYPVARHQDIPVMDIHLLESSANPTGTGEAAIAPAAAAIANAYARATGERPSRLPFTFNIAPAT